MDSDFPWTDEQTYCFIQARARLKIHSNETPDYVFQSIIDELGLTGQVDPIQARRYWDSLVTRYKELSQPALEPEDAAPPSWPFYAAMHDALLTMPPSVLPISIADEIEATVVKAFHGGQSMDGMEEEYDDEEEDEDDEEEEEEEDEEEDGIIDDDENMGEGYEDEDSQDMNESQGDENSQGMDGVDIDDTWTETRTLRFIELRGAKESDMVTLGPTPVFAEILEELGMSEEATVAEARKKWTQLVRRYLELKGPDAEDPKPAYGNSPSLISGDAVEAGWLFFVPMHSVMESIKATSPDGGTKARKSPEYTWSVDVTRKFIKIRGEKHTEISQKGHNAVYQDILEKLGIANRVNVMMARKKWNYLVKRYQDEEMAEGERTWAFMKEMGQVMKHFRGANVNKLKSRASPEFLSPRSLCAGVTKP